MRIRIAAATAAVALLAAGCGESCPTETPRLSQVANCTVRPGATVSYPIQLCPSCNQSGATCQVEIQGSTIQLDPTVEACTSSSGCPDNSCQVVPQLQCTFTAPMAAGTYNVFVYNPATDQIVPRTLTVSDTAPVSCSMVNV